MQTPSILKYPKKSHRKEIKLPEESRALAELMGIEFGDGGINNPWQVVISLNATLDRDYGTYVTNLFKVLFNLNTRSRIRGRNNLVLVCSSTNLVDFLIEKGAIRGNKISQKIDIPYWIAKTADFKKAFVRGLVDTDGCLFTHKHKVASKFYYNIGLCFTSYSKQLIQSVAGILREFGIKPHINKDETRIYLYSQKAVVDYLSIFGSSNGRIRNQYLKWRGVRVADGARLESV